MLKVCCKHSFTVIIYTGVGIARSWISHTVQPRTHADHWIVEVGLDHNWSTRWSLDLVQGMVGFLVAIYIEKAFGRNERRIQRQRITDDVVRGARLPWTIPISSELYGHPAEVHSLYFHQKSTIVMHMLADLIGESSFRDIVKQLIDDDAVLPQVFSLSALLLDLILKFVFRPGRPSDASAGSDIGCNTFHTYVLVWYGSWFRSGERY